MYKKIKYFLLIFTLIGMIFFYLDYYQNFNGNYFLGISNNRIKISAILLVLIFVFFFLPRKLKQRKDKYVIVATLIVLVFLFQNLNIGLNYYSHYRFEKILAEYKSLDCDKLKERFELDLKNNELKFFSGGLFYNKTQAKKLKKHKIENFFQGCMIDKGLDCYSNLVLEYLKKEESVVVEEPS